MSEYRYVPLKVTKIITHITTAANSDADVVVNDNDATATSSVSMKSVDTANAVSYTHLTLPTKRIV